MTTMRLPRLYPYRHRLPPGVSGMVCLRHLVTQAADGRSASVGGLAPVLRLAANERTTREHRPT
jgi:hypothetical protein